MSLSGDPYERILQETLRRIGDSREPADQVWERIEASLSRQARRRRLRLTALVAAVFLVFTGVALPPVRAAVTQMVTIWRGTVGKAPAEVKWVPPDSGVTPTPDASSVLRDRMMPVASVAEAAQLVEYGPAVLKDQTLVLKGVEVWLGTYSGLPDNESRSVFLAYQWKDQTYQVVTTALFRRNEGRWTYEPVPSLMVMSGAATRPGSRVIELPDNQEALCLEESAGGDRMQTRCHRLLDGLQVVVVGAEARQVEELLRGVVVASPPAQGN